MSKGDKSVHKLKGEREGREGKGGVGLARQTARQRAGQTGRQMNNNNDETTICAIQFPPSFHISITSAIKKPIEDNVFFVDTMRAG